MDAEDDYARRLRDVFDLCDVDKSDLISIDHFVQLANEHFGTSGWDTDNQEVCLFFAITVLSANADFYWIDWFLVESRWTEFTVHEQFWPKNRKK